jgi:hypothetical protein
MGSKAREYGVERYKNSIKKNKIYFLKINIEHFNKIILLFTCQIGIIKL